jgi:hypothetical protein
MLNERNLAMVVKFSLAFTFMMMLALPVYAQSPPPTQPPTLDLPDQLYLLFKAQSKQTDAVKEQMNELIRRDQAVAEWWQKVWDGLKKE